MTTQERNLLKRVAALIGENAEALEEFTRNIELAPIDQKELDQEDFRLLQHIASAIKESSGVLVDLASVEPAS